MSLPAPAVTELRRAKELLENPGLAARLSHMLGTPLEKGFELLPKQWKPVVDDATRRAIEAALDVAVRTIDGDSGRETSDWWHKVAVGATGAAGGAFGLATLALELPVSTTIMLRSIADIARSEGQDIRSPRARLECVQVLALGGESRADDAAETGYFAVRAVMAKAVSDALTHIGQRGVVGQGAPALVRLITAVAARFSINVSQKAAAQALPIVGAVGGAVINTMFIDHFQRTARGHFIVRRLERAHGAEEVERAYRAL